MKKVVVVGQAMPNHKRTPHHWPTLNAWFYDLGLLDEDIENNFLYTALLNYFPGYRTKADIWFQVKNKLKMTEKDYKRI